jgi:hypothetical protein
MSARTVIIASFRRFQGFLFILLFRAAIQKTQVDSMTFRSTSLR